MASLAGGCAAAAGRSTVELQGKVTDLAGLFARAISETSKAVEDAVENAYSTGAAAAAGGARINLDDLATIDKNRFELTTEVNNQVADIRALVDRLPGITSTTEELLKQLHKEEARNAEAGKALVAAQAEAKRWLEFVEGAEAKIYDGQ